jgi:hypothetical protein
VLHGVLYRAHRLAWFYVKGSWPLYEIDHQETQREDNRVAKLRDVTKAVNLQNQRRASKNNQLGILGVSVHRATGRFRAAIFVGGEQKHLGLFDCPRAARRVRRRAEKKYFAEAHSV